MKSLYKNEQSGRSMVEMLGVLAIIGVLSIGGISGYSKAMAKYRVNKTLDQISMLVMNIRTLFSSSVDYTGLNDTMAINLGIIPADMQLTGTSGKSIVNAYQGAVKVNVGTDTREFYVIYTGLTQEACVALATADWGSQAGSGLVSVSIAKGADNKKNVPAFEKDGIFEMKTAGSFPISLAKATEQCGEASDLGNAIKWTYY